MVDEAPQILIQGAKVSLGLSHSNQMSCMIKVSSPFQLLMELG